MKKTSTKTIRMLLSILSMSMLFSIGAMAQTGKQMPVAEALERITEKYKTKFAYDHNVVAGKSIAISAIKGKNLDEVLKNVLYPNNLLFLYVSENNYTIVTRDIKAEAGQSGGDQINVNGNQEIIIRGTVMDNSNVALPGASIKSNSSNQVTKTDGNGRFSLAVVPSTTVLNVSYIGYQTAQVILTGKRNIEITMIPDANLLQNVDIISNGYQTLPKERSTGSAATINAEEIKDHPQPNLLEIMEGKASGVKINLLAGDRTFAYSSGGSSGTQVALNGGTRTTGANDYNMSIRGTGTLIGESFPLVVVDGAVSELDISTLNPQDVENVTFLKDAAAASIWGVRAANGVMVITTKKGKAGEAPRINVSSAFSFSQKPDLNYLRTMTSAQELNYQKELVDRGFVKDMGAGGYYSAVYYNNQGTTLAEQLKAGTITQAAYDQKVSELSAVDNRSQISKYLLQAASNQQYNFDVSGGNNNSNYFYSASYSKEIPNAVGNEGKRLTLTLNNSWKLFKVATLSTSFRGSFFNYANAAAGLANAYSSGPSTLMPYDLIADANGNGTNFNRLNPAFTSTLPAGFKSWTYNYLDELNDNSNIQKDNNYTASINLKVPIIDGLSASANYNNERSFSNTNVYHNPDSYFTRDLLNQFTSLTSTTGNSLGISSLGGILQQQNTVTNNYNLRGQLDYSKTLNNVHRIDAIAGTEIRQTDVTQNTATLYGYNPATGISTAANYGSSAYDETIYGYSGTLGGAPTYGDKERRFLSYYSNASYSYNNKYVVSGSVRYDDYNNFGLDRKYRATPLWSTGFKWNASDESFIKDQQWISNLALRATYGVNGNISTTIYPYTYIGLSNYNPPTGLANASIINPANPQLKWEKTYVTNLGLDFGFLKSRINGSLDVYNKRGSDLLFAFPINTTYTGTITNNLIRNAATLNGHGVDMNISAVVYKNRDFSISTGGTFSYNVNKITDNRFTTNLTSAYYSQPSSLTNVTGYATDALFVYRNAGLDANGLTQIYDANNKKIGASTYTINSLSTLKYAGHKTAPYFGSYNASFNYKQFRLYALATYQFGSVFLKPSINNYITSPYSTNFDVSADIAKRWEKPGDEATTNVPGLNGSSSAVYYSLLRYQNSDVNVLSGDYIRLRELSLSYNLSQQQLKRLPVKGAGITVGVRNLGLLWTANKEGYDPDFVSPVARTYSLPPAKTYTLSVNVNF